MASLPRSLVLALILSALLLGCSKNPFEEDKARTDDSKDSSFILAQGLMQGSAQAAADLHQEAAAADRVQERMDAVQEPQVKAEVGVKSIGAPKGDPTLSTGTRPRSVAVGALLKASAGAWPAFAETFRVDSTTWMLADSAKGSIYALKPFTFSGPAGKGTGVDSVRYRWPHSPANPAVLSFDRRRDFDDGRVERSAAHDDDGDGLLSEAPAGKNIRLRRVWLTSRGDSLWKHEVFTEHGQTVPFDSLGAGKARHWFDTAFASGKVAWTRKTYDVDGDGFIATAAAGPSGGKAKIGNDTYADLGGGLFRMASETHGPGPDAEYGAAADNELYASSSYIVNDKGRDVNRSLAGDADGDGLLWSPADGAANRVWETAVWAGRDGLKSYKDSLVKSLGKARDADARVIHYSAASERDDGSLVVLSAASLDGLTPFGPSDTVLVSERHVHPAGDREKRDSTVRHSHLVPGRLDETADDRLVWWSVKVHYRAEAALTLAAETFTPAAPLAPGAVAAAGSRTSEERRRGRNPSDVVRVWTRHDFDKASGASAWKEIRNSQAGDSSVSTGGRAGGGGASHAQHTGKGFRSIGSYDPATGAFSDTVTFLDAKGAEAGRLVSEGTAKEGVGAVRRTIRRADGKSVAATITAAKAPGGALTRTRVTGKDTTVATLRGDTLTLEKRFGKATVSFTMARLGSGWTLDLTGKDAAVSTALTGYADFLSDGTGSGSLTSHAGGKPKPPVAFLSRADGSVLLDGKPAE